MVDRLYDKAEGSQPFFVIADGPVGSGHFFGEFLVVHFQQGRLQTFYQAVALQMPVVEAMIVVSDQLLRQTPGSGFNLLTGVVRKLNVMRVYFCRKAINRPGHIYPILDGADKSISCGHFLVL
jgi:hypothetical protein